uniref:Uncharacterized protein n=1 Tax=Rangifer tarandus platyrhynchus TaxID=3082113 RepID=A0ACB0EW65_RANTA|nr:unnamed protein product [Rangifer tarandus platyrhynchus]
MLPEEGARRKYSTQPRAPAGSVGRRRSCQRPESCGQVRQGRAKGPGLTRVSLVGAEDYGQCPAEARRVSSTALPTKNLPAHFGLAASILRRAQPFGKPSPPLAESRFSYA